MLTLTMHYLLPCFLSCSSHNFKQKLLSSAPEIIYQACDNRKQGQLVYSKSLNVSDVISTSDITDPNETIQSCMSGSEFDLSYTVGREGSERVELFHTGLAVKCAIDECRPPNLTWPPALSDLTLDACKKYVPPKLFNLVSLLVGATSDPPPENDYIQTTKDDYIKIISICQDIVNAATNGRVLTPKSLAVGLTMRHYTGNKAANNLLSGFGNAASYHTIMKLETAFAAQQQLQVHDSLPDGFEEGKWTTLVWDNIDFAEETVTGAGTTHYVNGLMVQKKLASNTGVNPTVTPISKTLRKLPRVDANVTPVKRYKRVGPTKLFDINWSFDDRTAVDVSSLDLGYVALKSTHQQPDQLPDWTRFNQVIYSASIDHPVDKSLIHYLPIIESPATDLTTIKTILQRSIELADKLRLEKIVLVFDQAIYSKIQEMRWTNDEYCSRTIVRLGEFHTAMAFLGILGKRFGAAGFSDIMIEANIVASGSMNGVLSGHHYNRSMRSHKLMYEALSRLRLENFFSSLDDETNAIYRTLLEALASAYPKPEFLTLLESTALKRFQQHLDNYITEKCSANPTYRFWCSYINMIELLLTFIRATRTSDWKLHLSSVTDMLPWYFAYDRTHYKR